MPLGQQVKQAHRPAPHRGHDDGHRDAARRQPRPEVRLVAVGVEDVRPLLFEHLDQAGQPPAAHAPCSQDVARLAGRQVVAVVDDVLVEAQGRLEARRQLRHQLEDLPLRPSLLQVGDEQKHLVPPQRDPGGRLHGALHQSAARSAASARSRSSGRSTSSQPWPLMSRQCGRLAALGEASEDALDVDGAPLRGQRRVGGRPVARRRRRGDLGHADVAGVEGGERLGDAPHPSLLVALDLHVVRAEDAIGVDERRHLLDLRGRQRGDRRPVDVVDVHDQERILDERPGRQQRDEVPVAEGAVFDQGDRQRQPRDLLGDERETITAHGDDGPRPRAPGEPDRVREERLAAHGDERLGHPFRQRAQAAAQPRRQQHSLHGRLY